jgi:O-antigen ligase
LAAKLAGRRPVRSVHLPSIHLPRAPRIDGTSLAVFYVLCLTLMPAKLAPRGIPLDIAPTLMVGLGLGVAWFCAQMVDTVGIAKSGNVVRTALFCYALTQLVTYGATTYAGLPGDELKATDRTIITLFSAVAVGLTLCDGVRGRAAVERVLKALVVGATIMAAIGAVQFLFGFDLVSRLNALPGLRSVADHGAILDRSSFRRPAGTAGHPIEYGVVCALALPLALYFGIREDAPKDERLWRWRVCLVVLAAGLMFSLSRSAILGAAVAGLVLFPTWSWRRRFRILMMSGLFVVAMRLFVHGIVGTLIALFTNFNNDVSIQGRESDYGPAMIEISRHLWLGRGVGTFLPEKYTWLDNQYLMTLVENGVIGLIAFVAVPLSGVYAALRVRAATRDPRLRELCATLIASLAVSLISAATFDLLSYAMITGLTFLLTGACAALLRDTRESRPDLDASVGGETDQVTAAPLG